MAKQGENSFGWEEKASQEGNAKLTRQGFVDQKILEDSESWIYIVLLRRYGFKWLWNEWVALEKPWVETVVPRNHLDRELFAAATIITVGNGKTTRF